MNSKPAGPSSLVHALSYANKQIDQFYVRGRLTFSELTVIVEALHAISGLSGALIFAYALMFRAKILITDERGYFVISDLTTLCKNNVDHVIPHNLREKLFFNENRVDFNDLTQFVPLYTLGSEFSTVLLKNMVWVKSVQKSIRLPFLMHCEVTDATKVLNNRYASVTVPIAYQQGDHIKCAVIQLSAEAFDAVRRAVTDGATAVRLRRSVGLSKSKFEALPGKQAANLDEVRTSTKQFWKEFESYTDDISLKNAKMPMNVIDSVTHTLIHSQKTMHELNSMLF